MAVKPSDGDTVEVSYADAPVDSVPDQAAFVFASKTLVEIPKMTHYMTHVESMKEALENGPNAPFEPLALDKVRAWLQRTAAS